MKRYLLPILTFVLGGAVGFWVSKKVYEGYYASIAQDEIDSVKDAFGRAVEAERTYARGTRLEVTKEDLAKATEETPKPFATRSSIRDTPKETKINYNAISTPPRVADQIIVDGKQVCKTPVDVTYPAPYLITDEQYNEYYKGHDKVSLYYYSEDRALSEENEERVSDIPATVGEDAVRQIARTRSAVWVRNERLGIDYEICYVRGSYEILVLGEPTEQSK